MSLEAVKQYFKEQDMESRVMEFQQSSATVEEAAAAIRCEPRQIAKTMSFMWMMRRFSLSWREIRRLIIRNTRQNFSRKQR